MAHNWRLIEGDWSKVWVGSRVSRCGLRDCETLEAQLAAEGMGQAKQRSNQSRRWRTTLVRYLKTL